MADQLYKCSESFPRISFANHRQRVLEEEDAEMNLIQSLDDTDSEDDDNSANTNQEKDISNRLE